MYLVPCVALLLVAPVASQSCVCVPFYQCSPDKLVDVYGSQDTINQRGSNSCAKEDELCCGLQDEEEEEEGAEILLPDRPAGVWGCGVRNIDPVQPDKLPSSSSDLEASFYGEFPWIVRVMNDDRLLGSGSIIKPNIVLTAAHCLYKQDHLRLILSAGAWPERVPIRSQVRRASKVVVHDGFRPLGYVNDIALIFLDEDFQLSPVVDTVCLPEHEEEWADCLLTPWYNTSGGEMVGRSMVKVRPRKECGRELEGRPGLKGGSLPPSTLCTDGVTNTASCQGEHGAPLVCLSEGKSRYRYTQVGVSSWRAACSSEGPSIHTSLSRFYYWIQEQIKRTEDEKEYFVSTQSSATTRKKIKVTKRTTMKPTRAPERQNPFGAEMLASLPRPLPSDQSSVSKTLTKIPSQAGEIVTNVPDPSVSFYSGDISEQPSQVVIQPANYFTGPVRTLGQTSFLNAVTQKGQFVQLDSGYNPRPAGKIVTNGPDPSVSFYSGDSSGQPSQAVIQPANYFTGPVRTLGQTSFLNAATQKGQFVQLDSGYNPSPAGEIVRNGHDPSVSFYSGDISGQPSQAVFQPANYLTTPVSTLGQTSFLKAASQKGQLWQFDSGYPTFQLGSSHPLLVSGTPTVSFGPNLNPLKPYQALQGGGFQTSLVPAGFHPGLSTNPVSHRVSLPSSSHVSSRLSQLKLKLRHQVG